MPDYLVQEEDGTSRIDLEESDGDLLLEEGEGGEARVSQLPVEVVVAPTSALARISQLPVEVVISPTDAKARISQMPIEVVMRNLKEDIQLFIIDAIPEE